MPISITLIGGPTALIEIDGFRLLTDPTFDAPGAYELPHVKLEKTIGPAVKADAIGPIDAVLLSHDQHSDNLDNSGRDYLLKAPRALTTEAGAKRLGGHVEGLAPWATAHLKDDDGNALTITATPARHGPAGIEPLSGDVIGFVVQSSRKDTRAFTSAVTPPGSTASPRSRAASNAAWCCRSRAPRKPAGRSISPWTPTTPSRPRAPSPTR